MNGSTYNLRIISYNSTGCNDARLSYLNDASSNADIILVQEHWLLTKNLHRITSAVSGFTGIANSGVDETLCILPGRPYGGCAILWRVGITHRIQPVQVKSLSKRICSVLLTLHSDYKILLLCAYFPTDPGTVAYDKAELDIVLSDITDVLINVQYDGLIVGGDINSDFTRTTGFVKNVDQYMKNKTLQSLWSRFHVDYTYRHTDGISTSTVDHFMVNNSVKNICVDGGVEHSVDNLSNHSVIYMILKLNSDLSQPGSHNGDTFIPKTAWYKANAHDINVFKDNIENKLCDISLCYDTLHCGELMCESDNHRTHLDDYFESMMTVLLDSSAHIPQTCPPKDTSRVPGWSELIKPYRDDAIFWKWMHDQAGHPTTGWVAQIMRRTRAQYHYAIKRAKSNKTLIKRFKLLEAMYSSDRDFFKEVRKIRGLSKTHTSCIDGLNDNSEIAGKFATQYDSLFNSNPSDRSDLKSMMVSLNNNIQSDNNSHADCQISLECLHKAVKRLKSEKQDGVFSMMASEHFINATESYYKHLCTFFNNCLRHGYMPHAMILSTLIPIPKDNNDVQNSQKYRGIALSAICTKLYEYIILELYGSLLTSSDLQFAYKSEASTTQCTWMAREVISYYNNNGSDVYACLLDCSKAFDRVRHDKLLKKLMSTGLPPVITRSLMFMYTNSKIRVKWKDAVSEPFSASNGVKQGSVLSPILFTLLLDDLIVELEKSGDGCRIGNKFYGCFGYADDLKLLCPGLSGLQRMLNICKSFSSGNGLTFNATKTLCIKFHSGKHDSAIVQYPVYLGPDKLKWYAKVTHLGHTFNCCLKFTADVANRKGQFIGCVNSIITQFGFSHPVCKLRLLVTHGYSFYGSPLWDLYGNDSEQLYTTWNIAVRRLFDLPRTAHTRFLSHIANVPHIKHDLKCRFVKFVNKAVNSTNSKVSYLAKLCVSNTLSITGNNVSNILCEYNIKMTDIVSHKNACYLMKKCYMENNDLNGEEWKCDMIVELLDCMYGLKNCGLSNEEAKECIAHVASD